MLVVIRVRLCSSVSLAAGGGEMGRHSRLEDSLRPHRALVESGRARPTAPALAVDATARAAPATMKLLRAGIVVVPGRRPAVRLRRGRDGEGVGGGRRSNGSAPLSRGAFGEGASGRSGCVVRERDRQRVGGCSVGHGGISTNQGFPGHNGRRWKQEVEGKGPRRAPAKSVGCGCCDHDVIMSSTTTPHQGPIGL